MGEKIDGTIIDIETIGEFCEGFGVERYKQVRPITAGFLCDSTIEILYITGEAANDFRRLKNAVESKLVRVKRPFYAFNAEFEMGVLHWFLGRSVKFDRDLMLKTVTACGNQVWESKRVLVKCLGIQNFDDPFWDLGYKVPDSWQRYQATGDKKFLEDIVLHNRACLLKEHAILNTRKRWREIQHDQMGDDS